MGAHVKKTVSSRKDLRPQTSDRAPMRGALRKDSRPWEDGRRGENGRGWWAAPFSIWPVWHTGVKTKKKVVWRRIMSNDNQKRDGCFCADAFETLHFCFHEPSCLKLKNQPLISVNQSLIKKKKKRRANTRCKLLCKRLKHQEKLVGKNAHFPPQLQQ